MALPNPIRLMLSCIFTGSTWLVLINFADCLYLSQKPRYLGVKSGRSVKIYCVGVNESVHWYRTQAYGSQERKTINKSSRIMIDEALPKKNASLSILKVTPEDSGIYYCEVNNKNGSGTELRVVRHITPKVAEKRSNMKDSMIIIQGLLLVLCATAPVLLYFYKGNNEDGIYEEPQDDHLYEGLTVEHCDLYEDIPAYSQPAEAEWESPETPCEE
ncbi:B-cell antigen receptor complex-associated protein alpha chain [Brienomyrus brachyistius]|uniref:B-cell antigen receptor complex-associated protein alpha chain n=1 Tax=Brienomyrus brachyistius TaxID=42636 RepID=UPI0020B3A433|nr:B-cell antigen receptor complex-associated protein alpha chain [Brienomyrus brachyistius]